MEDPDRQTLDDSSATTEAELPHSPDGTEKPTNQHSLGSLTSSRTQIGDDPDLVTWDGPHDKDNPQNFTPARKLLITAIWIYGCLVTCIASSIFSSAHEAIVAEFNASPTVATLGVSLFLLGYTVAPPLWGPLSERFGRRWPMLLGTLLFTIFCVPVAVADNLETVLVGRFLQAAGGSAAMSLAGGGLVDIWSPEQRGLAVVGMVSAVFGSPIIAPVMGNFIAASHLGWRWTQWISCIMGGSCTVLVLFCLPETLPPLILQSRAAKMRREGNPNARSEFDGAQKGIKALVQVYLLRPFVLLATEPILVLITIYQSFIFGILYLVFVSYPYAFRKVRGWELGVSSLPFLGMFVGVILGALVLIVYTRAQLVRASKTTADGKGKLVPEDRLPMMTVGGCLIPVGLFIFAWTSDPSIHWSGMVIGGSVPMGMGMYMVFAQCFAYLMDVYAPIANSAMASNTFVRSAFGAGFPLFAPSMYDALGVDWATSTLGFVSIAMIPIPILYYRYGARIRSWSKNSVSVT